MKAGRPSHEALLAALQAGEPGAEHAFWQEHWPRVLAVCAGVLGPGFSAEEVAVEVLVEFITRYAHRLTHGRATSSYLRLMAVQRASREKRRRSQPSFEDMDRFMSEAHIDPERQATCRLLLPRLEECVGGLTDKAQRAVKLRFFAELTNERIGELLGCSKQYVGRLLDKSLVALRRCLERAAWRASENAAGGPSP